MSIVANKFEELPSPIICPKLKLLMLKLRFEDPFKLQDDFFDEMSNINVLSLRGYGYVESILHFPASIRRLSSLRTLCLSDLRLDDISFIGELVELKILSIRDCELEEVPVEIGKLTNLIMLELRYDYLEKLKRIPAGVLSRLVRLEELHIMGVEDCSYSTFREVESLSKLTALSLRECSEDVIYIPSNLGLSSKLARDNVEGIEFPLLREMLLWSLPELQNLWPKANNSITDSNPLFDEKVSCPNLELLSIDEANSISALCSPQLPTDYFTKLQTLQVSHCGKLRNLMSPSVAKGLLNLKKLQIENCESMEEVITKGEGIMTLFPLLEILDFRNLPKLGHFFLTECALKFPFLEGVNIEDCPEMKTFVQQGISVSTPSLRNVNFDDMAKVDDLNKWIQQRFNNKEQEASDGNKAEPSHSVARVSTVDRLKDLHQEANVQRMAPVGQHTMEKSTTAGSGENEESRNSGFSLFSFTPDPFCLKEGMVRNILQI
ncbi:probable disease resistance protein At1g61310 [Solanum stenotomum]|uniref:probable disease resistance protein At1g61310 n=1 Tax=Solanum stenotomum TaxID=172797 RepID=UPI0020D077AD|nr:probable disease resistance protein At1g61310 [Solanum stenotomum]